MPQQFGTFTATELHCPKCGRAQPVRELLLLVLPSGELHEYLCVRCLPSLGKRTVTGLVVPRTYAAPCGKLAGNENLIVSLEMLKPELIAVAAYGRTLPPAILDLPPFGCLNVHTSLLPKSRRSAPIQCAILNADTETGVTIMKMDPGMDTG